MPLQRVFLQDLRGKELLQVVAKTLVIVDDQFQRALDAVEPRVAVSVLFRHSGLLSLSDIPVGRSRRAC